MQRLLIIITAIVMAFGAMAQKKATAAEREAWAKEMQQFRSDYMARKLDLSDDQKVKFTNLYNRMDGELKRVQDQTRRMAREVEKKGDKATDLEREKAAEAQFELKGKEAEIEMKYYKEFKTVLNSRQLLKFKDAERAFMRDLMKKHREGNKKP